MDGTFTKYFYISLMFIVSFIAMYNTVTASIGFALIFAVQIIYTVVFLFELVNDLNRNNRSLTLEFPKTIIDNNVSIPLYWVLCPGIIMHFIASMLTALSTSFLHKKFNSIKLNRNLAWNLDMYKWMFVAGTISLLGLTRSYVSDFANTSSSTNFTGGYKSLLTLLFFASIIFPVINVINAKKLSKIMVTSTDG
jgi:hypothetical protein